MKTILKVFMLAAIVLPADSAWADLTFAENTGYRIVCTQYGGGGVLVGSEHGLQTPIFYSESDATSADAYWIFSPVGDGVYTICNSATGQYITYDGERTNAKRYVALTNEPDGENSQWRITTVSKEAGTFSVAQANNAQRKLNVRQDGVHIVGTFDSQGTAGNETLSFIDAQGNLVYDDTPYGTETFSDYVDSLLIGGKMPVFDAASKEYLLPVKEECLGKDFEAQVVVKFKKANYSLEVNDQEVSSVGIVDFGDVSGGKSAEFQVRRNGKTLASAIVNFTFMPVVEVLGSNIPTDSYVDGYIRVTDAEAEGVDTIINAGFRYRGATAAGMAKKSLAVKLRDSNGQSIDCSFFGLRSDNNWILDAMAIDRARMRNRVSTDLWLDFSEKPYHSTIKPKAINGTRGRFVEVVFNGSYAGIYCMTEKVDRKQLKLRKMDDDGTINGVLYKSTSWTYSVLMGHYPDNRSYPKVAVSAARSTSEAWDGWESKYPDLEDSPTIDWNPLRKAINIVATGSKNNFTSMVEDYFDLPVWRDYYLFTELMLATDNHGKNEYLYSYDKNEYNKMSVTPWDLDGTWGLRWDGSENITANASQDFISFLWANEHGENNLYRMLTMYDYKDWKENLSKRYAKLRANHFNPDTLVARFNRYYELFRESGADVRERDRWNNSNGIPLDFETEMSYLSDWITKRVAALDVSYNYDPATVGISNVVADGFSVTGGAGEIVVVSDNGMRIRVYSPDGLLVRKIDVSSGLTEIKGLPAGIYIVNGKKVLVR